MAPSCLQYLAECGSSLLCAAVDHGEVEVGRVAVVGKVDEREAGATFEDEPPTDFRSGVVELRVPERLGFEVDGLGPLDDDPERTAADGRDADLCGASDGDRADGIAEQPKIGEGTQVGDAMVPVAEGGPDGEGEIVGGGRGVERAEGADGVAPSAQPVDQAVVLQPSQGVRGGSGRAVERGPGFVEGELLLALGDEGVDQFPTLRLAPLSFERAWRSGMSYHSLRPSLTTPGANVVPPISTASQCPVTTMHHDRELLPIASR